MVDIIDILFKLFEKLNSSVSYLNPDRTPTYYQSGSTVVIGNIYFKLNTKEFIKRSTIDHNKSVLDKLLLYKADHFIDSNKFENGIKFNVYDPHGNMVYSQRVFLYDISSRFTKWRLRKKFPQISLKDGTRT